MIDAFHQQPPLLRYIVCGLLVAVFAFLLHAALPKREQRLFDASLLIRYLALGVIFAGAIYAVFHHREILQV